jgi:hypothetical protein
MGLRASETAELLPEDCRVPASPTESRLLAGSFVLEAVATWGAPPARRLAGR